MLFISCIGKMKNGCELKKFTETRMKDKYLEMVVLYITPMGWGCDFLWRKRHSPVPRSGSVPRGIGMRLPSSGGLTLSSSITSAFLYSPLFACKHNPGELSVFLASLSITKQNGVCPLVTLNPHDPTICVKGGRFFLTEFQFGEGVTISFGEVLKALLVWSLLSHET